MKKLREKQRQIKPKKQKKSKKSNKTLFANSSLTYRKILRQEEQIGGKHFRPLFDDERLKASSPGKFPSFLLDFPIMPAKNSRKSFAWENDRGDSWTTMIPGKGLQLPSTNLALELLVYITTKVVGKYGELVKSGTPELLARKHAGRVTVNFAQARSFLQKEKCDYPAYRVALNNLAGCSITFVRKERTVCRGVSFGQIDEDSILFTPGDNVSQVTFTLADWFLNEILPCRQNKRTGLPNIKPAVVTIPPEWFRMKRKLARGIWLHGINQLYKTNRNHVGRMNINTLAGKLGFQANDRQNRFRIREVVRNLNGYNLLGISLHLDDSVGGTIPDDQIRFWREDRPPSAMDVPPEAVSFLENLKILRGWDIRHEILPAFYRHLRKTKRRKESYKGLALPFFRFALTHVYRNRDQVPEEFREFYDFCQNLYNCKSTSERNGISRVVLRNSNLLGYGCRVDGLSREKENIRTRIDVYFTPILAYLFEVLGNVKLSWNALERGGVRTLLSFIHNPEGIECWERKLPADELKPLFPP